MKDYELTLIIDPDLSGEERKKILDKIKKTIDEEKGKVGEEEEWGAKKLAYPIKNQMGYYFWWKVSLEEKTLFDLNSRLRQEEKILRYLLVRAEVAKTGGKHVRKVTK